MDDLGTDEEVNHKQQMEELALNSDFDPGLLDCWADEEEEEEEEANAVTTSGSSCNNSLPSSLAAVAATSSASSFTQQQQQQGFRHSNNHNSNTRSRRSHKGAASGVVGLDTTWCDEFDKAHESLLIAASANASLSRSTSSLNGNNDVSSMPAFETTATGTALQQTHQQIQQHQQHLQQPAVAPQPQDQQHHLHLGQVPPSFGAVFQQQQQMPAFSFPSMDSVALLPLAFNALAAGVDLSAFFSSAANEAAAYGAAMANHHQQMETNNNSNAANQTQSQQAPAPAPVLSAPPTSTSRPSPDQPASQTTAAAETAPAATPQTPRKNRGGGGKGKKHPSNSSSTNNNNSNNNAEATSGGPRKGKGRGKRQAKQEEEDEEEPPFMLFDAPVELRHNFMQTQRALGLPVLYDNNSYHFARAATLTNPNNNNNNNPATTDNSPSRGALPTAQPMPRLADARIGDDATGNKRIKNAKEQKRAQRITELIEQLRVRMEKGGWKVGIKSKLHTLSSCSDYVKHLVKATKEKEAAVEQARIDLEAKRRKIEDEKASQQDPSEPESTTSSLTVSSESRSTNNKKSGSDANNGSTQETQNSSSTDKNDDHDNANNDTKNSSNSNSDRCGNQEKHQTSLMDCNVERNHTLAANGSPANRAASEDFDASPGKKRKLSSHDSNNSEGYPSSVENEDNGNKKRRAGGVGQHVSIGPVSSVSDITDNNKYSKGSSATSSSDDITMSAAATPGGATASNCAGKDAGGEDGGQGDGALKETADPAGPSAQDTVCSDAAVAATLGPDKDHSHGESFNSRDADNRDPAMAIQTITTTKNMSHYHHHHHRKRKLQQELSKLGKKVSRDPSSIESSFRLDYEEVFLKSNVPQIISSTTGRIVAFNEIFLRSTCLKRSQVERLTIFSLVQTSMLSNLFELVASSLREDDRQEERKAKDTATPLQDYSTMTLPCVPFHADRPPLFMTITLMTDEDVKKRCFHCVFTDCAPGVKGSVGSVTPQLLATLFQPHGGSSQEDQPSGSDGCESRGGSSGNGTKNSSLTSNSNSGESGQKQYRQPEEEHALNSAALVSPAKKEQKGSNDMEGA